MGRKVWLGFIATLIVGGVGGFGIKLFAKDLVPAARGVVPAPHVDAAKVRVVEVEGDVRALTQDGTWRPIRPGFALERPTGLELGPDAFVRIEFLGVRLEASHGANLLIGAPGTASGIQVEWGLVVVGRTGKEISTFVPRLDAKVTGRAYGVWAFDELLHVAVLSERVEIEHADERAARYGKAREIKLTRRKSVPSVLNERLELAIESSTPRGRRTRVKGRTAAGAFMFRRSKGSIERVRLSVGGAFDTTVELERPQRGELVAYDAAGRRAEDGRPSGTIDERFEVLMRTGVRPRDPATVTREDEEAIRSLAGDRSPPPPPREPPVSARRPPRAARRPPPPPARAVEPAPARRASPPPPPRAGSRAPSGRRGDPTPEPVKVPIPSEPSPPPAAAPPPAPPPKKAPPVRKPDPPADEEEPIDEELIEEDLEEDLDDLEDRL